MLRKVVVVIYISTKQMPLFDLQMAIGISIDKFGVIQRSVVVFDFQWVTGKRKLPSEQYS